MVTRLTLISQSLTREKKSENFLIFFIQGIFCKIFGAKENFCRLCNYHETLSTLYELFFYDNFLHKSVPKRSGKKGGTIFAKFRLVSFTRVNGKLHFHVNRASRLMLSCQLWFKYLNLSYSRKNSISPLPLRTPAL